MLTVEKIGGTSMSALSEVLQNIIRFERSGSKVIQPDLCSLGICRRDQLAALENKESKNQEYTTDLRTTREFDTRCRRTRKTPADQPKYEPLGF